MQLGRNQEAGTRASRAVVAKEKNRMSVDTQSKEDCLRSVRHMRFDELGWHEGSTVIRTEKDEEKEGTILMVEE